MILLDSNTHKSVFSPAFIFRFLAGFLPWLILGGCKTTPNIDLKQQKSLQIAILPGYNHPSAYRRIEVGINEAMDELSQVNAVIWRSSDNNPAKDSQTVETEVQQIIEQGFDVLVLLGDPLVDVDASLRMAQEAGLFVIYCGFAPKTARIQVNISTNAETDHSARKNHLSLVHLNILPASRFALQDRFTRLLHRQRPALLLFGPSELAATQQLYRQLGPSIRANRDGIQAVFFLNPFRVESSDKLQRAILGLPPDGQVIVLEPFLLYSSAQILQRYSLGTQIAGLGWQDISNPLLSSGRIEFLIPLRHRVLTYTAIHAAFALYSGQNQGNENELFLLGKYGQRRVTQGGVIVVEQLESISRSTQQN